MDSHTMPNGLARLDREGRRAEVVLDRPEKRNALSEPLMADLTEAFDRAAALEDARVVLARGEGPVFCAGMDLEMMQDRSEGAFDPDAFPDLLAAVADCPLPTVAAVHGAAPAGGFELTLPFDLRVLGADASYGVLEVQLGTFPHGGATQRLPRLVGLAKAKEIVLTGEFVDPEEAKRCGLVTEVAEPGAVTERARALADDLAENAPLGMVRAKEALDAALDTPLEQGLAYERALGRETYDTRDYREGMAARLAGREPTFEGR